MRCIFAALSLAVWGASLAKSTAAGPPIQRMQPLSATLRLETGQRRTWRCLEGVRDLPRGGEQNEPSRVSVSPEETLPPGIAGASMMAFRAPVPVSQATHRTYDDETEETGDSEAPQATKADAHAHAHAHAHADLTIPPAPPSMLAKRLANLRERALPAILMLAVVGSIAKFLKEDGLIGLALLLQAGMYQETTRVVGGDFPHPFYKWWWFLTASVALNAPFILSWARQEIAAGAMGMAMFGIFSVIVRFNWKGAQVEEFRDFLRQAAVSFLASLLVMLPSSYWIATLEEFGMKWVALPAALVIINDTMAYFFGVLFGSHKLLPVISPGKTWEGFLGAALSTVGASYYLVESKRDAVALSIAVSFIGPFGGFLASMIKRAYAQKDFGSLFPGHGGLVDRLDCHMILAPIVFLYLSLVNKYNS